MAQVDRVEQYEEKKVFFGLNNMDSWGKRAHFQVIKDYIIILTQEGGKNFLQAQKILLCSFIS